MIKKLTLTFVATLLSIGSAFADEGMWMLPLLEKLNSKDLAKAGCKLTPEQIYSINHSSLKDAVVQFGRGCTAEIISDEGLLVTNHHCGYSSIQALSSVEHDYLSNGFWAMNRSEELPVKGLTVTFLQSMTDVTKQIQKACKSCKDDSETQKTIAETIKTVTETYKKENPGCDVYVQSYYDSNVYYVIVNKTYRDIRFVGAPPSSIGKFGADTDNWMWPRHTCDFSMFRVYAGKDNEPAAYSPDNVPYTPKQHLKISLKGVQEGDYTMIIGYPGSTTRFQTSPELQLQIDLNDVRISARTVRQDIMMEEMLADPAVKIQYASKYSSSSNGWKKWQGMKAAFEKLDVIERAKEEENQFNAWACQNKKRYQKYGTVTEDLAKCVEERRAANIKNTVVNESLVKVELFSMPMYAKLYAATCKEKDTVAYVLKMMKQTYKDYCERLDRKEAVALTEFYRKNAKKEDYLKSLPEDFATMDISAWVDGIFNESAFTSYEKLEAALSQNGLKVLEEDPSSKVIASQLKLRTGAPAGAKGPDALAKARKTYTEGLMEWRKDEIPYPDANLTMRLTYGHVKSYSPKDAVLYKHYTTLDGVMEKEDPDNWEFVVPSKLKELYKAKDFGQYALPDGKMPACFLCDCDITGGNSGSPVMNADGELLGLAFDGNWEAMSGDVMFEPELQRCINVDIRYVLLVVDKFGGAGYLIDEMDLVK